MIAPAEVNTYALSTILDNAALDCVISPSGSIYLRDGAVPCWIGINSETCTLVFQTYWALRPDEPELEVLRLVNRANVAVSMVQFSAPPSEDGGHDKFFGEYVLPFKEGLSPKLFLRTARAFGEAFKAAVMKHDPDDLLADTIDGSTRDETAERARHPLN